MAEEIVFDINEIKRILAHRYPFLLIDRVVEFVDSERLVAVKAVSVNEPFFQGHFPERPVMPGVLILEALAQAGAILAIKSKKGVAPGKQPFLVAADKFKWKKQVVPGDLLRIEAISESRKGAFWSIRGEVTVDGALVASGVLKAAEVDF
ncbi:MAG: 3-hydroxyacyl-[acyl-carrier-protein] dehydratase FabZ [Candidatus Dadabacteria bacterium]|nr:MAG: 3-hydroxyacyl-[acyl-carrier-protein] dehydratase FabZ [Candidatus Dadabacteria bacterium]